MHQGSCTGDTHRVFLFNYFTLYTIFISIFLIIRNLNFKMKIKSVDCDLIDLLAVIYYA